MQGQGGRDSLAGLVPQDIHLKGTVLIVGLGVYKFTWLWSESSGPAGLQKSYERHLHGAGLLSLRRVSKPRLRAASQGNGSCIRMNVVECGCEHHSHSRFTVQPKPHVPACRYDSWHLRGWLDSSTATCTSKRKPQFEVARRRVMSTVLPKSQIPVFLGGISRGHLEDLADIAGYCVYEGVDMRLHVQKLPAQFCFWPLAVDPC